MLPKQAPPLIPPSDHRPRTLPPSFSTLALTRSPSPNDVGPSTTDETTLILFCYDRPEYLERTLASLNSRLPRTFNGGPLHIVISQDGTDPAVGKVVLSFVQTSRARGHDVEHVHHPRDSLRGTSSASNQAAYYRLAQHYGWGLNLAFARPRTRRVIILEDDLELAVDFFDYMQAFAPLLDDPQEDLLAVSAWNDHGQAQFVKDPDVFYRSDFFPGLGWMLARRVWDEQLSAVWPDSYWDDWLREPERRRGRHVIRPQISRTITFGKSGASMGQFFDKYLSPMRLNSVPVAYTPELVAKLRAPAFAAWFSDQVRSSPIADARSVARGEHVSMSSVRVEYSSQDEYRQICYILGMMDDIKAGVPRGAYKGVVPLVVRNVNVFVTPRAF